MPRLPRGVALARGLHLPRLRRASRLGARAPAPLGVLGLRSADLGHGRDGDAPNAHPAADLVLGRLSGRHPSPRDLGQAAAAPARALTLRDGVADPAEAAPGDGGSRARALEGRGRDRRLLARRARGGPQRQPPARQEGARPVSYTHLRAHETKANLVCRLLLEKKKKKKTKKKKKDLNYKKKKTKKKKKKNK